MREFEIRISSVQDVQAFVALATTRPFPVHVRDARRQVSGKSFMEMFCLDLHRSITVEVQCSDEELEQLLMDLDRFVVK